MFTKIKDGIQFGIGIVIVLAISGITYASYNALTTVESGDSLTKDSWNQMITNQMDLDARLNNAVDTDTKLTESEVDSFVENNDYVISTDIIDNGTSVDINGDILIDMMRYTGANDHATLDTAIASMYCASLNTTYSQVIKQTITESCTSTCSKDATYSTCSGSFFWNPRGLDARVYTSTCSTTARRKYCCCQ